MRIPQHVRVPCAVAAGILAIVMAARVGEARAIRVPGEIPTIQGAFDILLPGDSVLVDSGVYAESLVGPDFQFVLMGVGAAPVLDPSSVAGSDTLPCLILPEGSAATIEDFTFLNGAAMYPRDPPRPGGIRLFGQSLILRRCEFDSVFQGIIRGEFDVATTLILDQCRFVDSQYGCVYSPFSSLEATDCLFSGANGYLVVCGNMRVEGCRFGGETSGYLLLGFDGGQIRNCLFGPHGPSGFQSVRLLHFSGVVENNVFTDCAAGHHVLHIQMPCHGESLRVANNVLTENSGGSSTSFGFGCDSFVVETPVLEVRDNVVEFSRASGGGSRGLLTAVPGMFTRNRFHRLEPDTPAATRSNYSEGVVLRENIFSETGLAAAVHRPDIYPYRMDARWNWWGHASGPYHPLLNPQGLGDAVGDSIPFDPWYPDTSFLETPVRTRPSVASAALQAFPNPFNATVTLKFEIPEPGIFRMELFDLLGRRVRELWAGPVACEKTIRVDGRDLASGIYFARVWQPLHNRPVATAKLVLIK